MKTNVVTSSQKDVLKHVEPRQNVLTWDIKKIVHEFGKACSKYCLIAYWKETIKMLCIKCDLINQNYYL